MSDEEVVVQVLTGETALFEIIMRRYNQRLYRATRAILRDDAQAEEAVGRRLPSGLSAFGGVCRASQVWSLASPHCG